MSHFDRTYQRAEFVIKNYRSTATVFSAITDKGDVITDMTIRLSNSGGRCETSLAMNPAEMRELAAVLNQHADRVEALIIEANFLAAEAA